MIRTEALGVPTGKMTGVMQYTEAALRGPAELLIIAQYYTGTLGLSYMHIHVYFMSLYQILYIGLIYVGIYHYNKSWNHLDKRELRDFRSTKTITLL